jgi:hypothetical protein
MRKTIKIQLLIISILVLGVEMGFRIAGDQPGVYDKNYFKPVQEFIHEPQHQADSLGMIRFVKDSPHLPSGHIINNQGFRSSFDFDKNTIDSLAGADGLKTVMIIGDSYTEGCCANPITESFPDKLGREEGLLLLNFGVGATDPTQYWLVAKEYVPKIRPDLVVVSVYLGNDVMRRARPPRPFTPKVFPVKDCGWLPSEIPFFVNMRLDAKEYFKTPEESYEAIVKSLTLLGEESFAGKVSSSPNYILLSTTR